MDIVLGDSPFNLLLLFSPMNPPGEMWVAIGFLSLYPFSFILNVYIDLAEISSHNC